MLNEIIKIHESPLKEKLQEELITLGRNNNFNLDAQALGNSGSYYVTASIDGNVIAMRRFLQHVFRTADNESIKVLQACDTLTDKNFRGRGLFSKLFSELKISVGNNYVCTFNFPNNLSYAAYIKDGFNLVNNIITVVMDRAPIINNEKSVIYYDDLELAADQTSWLKHNLKNGLHRYLPIYSYVANNNILAGESSKQHFPRFYSLSGNHLESIHNMRFIKSILFSYRPVTFYSFQKEFIGNDLYLNAASYDTSVW